MSCNCTHKDDAEEFVCSCDQFEHPLPLDIGAGLNELPRQIAGFPEFRRAMLRAIGAKDGLVGWRARERDDLGVMLLEMWAYICDSLSFYDKVIADEMYVRTSKLRPSLRKLVALLGYLPAPATGSMVKLAAMADGRTPVTVPAGTSFRSAGFASSPPQVFELDGKTVIHPFNNKWTIASFQPLVILRDNPDWLLVEKRAELKPLSKLLLLDYQNPADQQVLTIKRIEPYTGADGRRYTKLFFQSPARLAKNTPLSQLWLLQPDPKSLLGRLGAVMESKSEVVVAQMLKLAEAEGIADEFNWEPFMAGLPVRMEMARRASAAINLPKANAIELALRYGLPTVADIVNEFKQSLSATDPLQFDKRPEKVEEKYLASKFALLDKNHRGVIVNGNIDYDESALRLHVGQDWQPDLAVPVEVYGNLLSASRGETIRNEILGSGNAAIASQQFKLARKPLTYLLKPSAMNDRGVESTLRIYVDGIRWKEVPGFFARKADEEIYIIRQNDEGESFVIFGDGVRGRRLPTGVNNVIAYYRYGAGKANPPAGSITQIQSTVPGLASINNPMAAFGGADAEDISSLRNNAPKSALILGRAVSMGDMEAVALATPGVRKVQTEWHWHGKQQCAVAYIWYIGEAGIETMLIERLRNLSDPSTHIAVEMARGVPVSLNIDIEIDERFIEEDVIAAVRQSLTNKTDGLLMPEQLGVGKPLFRSKIFERILSVPGAVSVRNISWDGLVLNKYAKKPTTGTYFDFENGEILINGNK